MGGNVGPFSPMGAGTGSLLKREARERRLAVKRMISVALAFALTLSAGVTLAGDTFQAFHAMPAEEQVHLAPLSDTQLAAIEGEHVAALILLLLSAIKDHIPMIPRPSGQIIWHSETQVNTEPGSSIQRNVVEVTQRQGNAVNAIDQSK